jgi:hypothetical protein
MVLGRLTQTVSKYSQCICTISDEVPCWKHAPDAFEVFWYAKWDTKPVQLTDKTYDPQDSKHSEYTFSVLSPSPALYPRTTRYRHLLRVPYEVMYFSGSRRWGIAGAGPDLQGEDLAELLKSYERAVDLRDSAALEGQQKWQSNRLSF